MGGNCLPKCAESASATCPAGTIGIPVGAPGGGAFGGHSDCGASTPPGPNGAPRVAGPGASCPPLGAADNKEFCPPACAAAACGTSKGSTITSAGHSRP